MTSVDSNFNFLCTSTWGLTPPPVHMRLSEPDLLPLRVDVINGWPLKELLHIRDIKVAQKQLLKQMGNTCTSNSNYNYNYLIYTSP